MNHDNFIIYICLSLGVRLISHLFLIVNLLSSLQIVSMILSWNMVCCCLF
jgi:hypothetical protein